MGRAKLLLVFSIIVLFLVGLSYAKAMETDFTGDSLAGATFIQLIPDECKVLKASEGVTASIEFNRDRLGNVTDRTYVHLTANDVYAGANASFDITAQNISSIPVSVDSYTLSIDSGSSSMANLIYFSGSVKIYRDNSEYYDLLGTFSKVRLSELAENLTNIMKYRKIDASEKLVLELDQQFDDDAEKFAGKDGLSYQLVPVFIQYFPKSSNTPVALG